MDYNRMVAKEMAGMGGKFLHGKTIGNVSPDIEWIKWLSYEPEFEKKRIEYFDSKRVSELSYEELLEACIYSRNKVFARLFKIYGTQECSTEDYMKVYDFMCQESIEKLMLSKLTVDELQYAKQEITRLRQVPKEQLRAKVEEEQQPEKYAQLSMVDSYILHMISDIDYAREMSKLDREIKSHLEQNDIMRQKSLYYASTSYVGK